VTERPRPGTLAWKVDRLLELKSKADRTRYSYKAVEKAIARQAKTTGGPTISAAYLHDLHSGKVTNAGVDKLQALVNWALPRVGLGYFGDDETARKTQEELEWLMSLHDAGVRDLAARLIGLEADDRQAVRVMVEHLTRRRALPPDRRDDPTPPPADP
jgi:ESX-1-secreted protein regulator